MYFLGNIVNTKVLLLRSIINLSKQTRKSDARISNKIFFLSKISVERDQNILKAASEMSSMILVNFMTSYLPKLDNFKEQLWKLKQQRTFVNLQH